jgi:hypothetical protein
MLDRFLAGTLAIALILSASVVRAADIDDAKAAVKKLADAPNYTWTTSIQGGRGNQTPVDYKTEKGGYTTFTVTPMNGDPTDMVVKDGKGAAKTADGWKSQAELLKAANDAGGFSPEMILLSRIVSFATPATQAMAVLDKAASAKKEGDVISADIPEAIAKDFLAFKLPPGLDSGFPAMETKDAKGTLKLSLKDGAITKIEIHLTGTRNFNDQDTPVDQTSTLSIKDVGTTKVTVSDEAKKKLEAPAATAPATAPKP